MCFSAGASFGAAVVLAAAGVAVLWLDVPFGGIDWIGTFCILITIVLLTLGTKKKAF